MFSIKSIILAVLLFCAIAVSALPTANYLVERGVKATPADWDTKRFEDYQIYHTRYDALSCRDKHNTPFFTSCCGPLKKGVALSTRPAECDPTKTTGTPINQGTNNTTTGDEDDDDCTEEEVDDDEDCTEEDY